ncbi:LpqB family beta-propeller domain-containing protein [Actinomycetospora lemnae]|uniref:LpqB family beta-propeller domain-containing protein n=1 Tax=Actinomycetospora lemnae TaxID=3019891 RepID=A0ABT5SPR1_9PSEU|nr:LpqB family beta-propeller domain-containing protein [Actinomycetospora sp. DW7H6]MDD7963768.1 LpqB family beta-propeller domain-containing protein [Actinomycetospora sp. DW7H6]
MSGARRLLAALALLLALALAAGCASVPGSSEVTVLRRVGDAAEPTAPPGPMRDAGPLETVRGWVLASGATAERHRAARAFLTPAAAGTWDDGAAPVVVNDQVDTVFADRPVPVGEAAVRIRATALGVLTPEGVFVAGVRPVEVDVGLVEQNGQWRIASLPTGTIVRRSDLRANTRPVRTWFLDPQRAGPVSDPRYLATTPARSVPTRTVQYLLSGPSESLAGAAVSSLPVGTTLRSDVTITSEGAAVVDLARTGPLDDPRRREIAQQVSLTLAGIGVTRTRLLVDGEPLLPATPEVDVTTTLQGLPLEVARRPDLPADPVVGGPGDSEVPVLVADAGRLRLLSGEPAGGPAGRGTYRAVSASASFEGDVAVVAEDGPGGDPAATRARLLTGVGGSELTASGVEGRSLARPTWTPDGAEVWSVLDGTTVVRAARQGPGGAVRPVAVDASALAGAGVAPRPGAPGPLSALRISPDGSRLALVAGGRVLVAAIARDTTGGARLGSVTALRPEALDQVLDIGWTRTDQLVAVGNRADRPVTLVSVDGLDLESLSTTNLTPPVTAVAARPGRPLVVADQSGTWTLPLDGGSTSGGDVWQAVPGFGASTVPSYPG